jgi:2-methylcitrate dehydratase
MVANARPKPDKELTAIADYILRYRIRNEAAFDSARASLTDTMACALDALDSPECTKLLGPVVPGTVVPHGARVPGTSYVLDPVNAAFSFGAMIRWLDFNDTFTAAQGSHPSDHLGSILMLADYLSRRRVAAGGKPLVMRDVLAALIKAYEIQGCLALENDLQAIAIDHSLLTRVAGAAVLTGMLNGAHDEIVNAVSNAFIESPLACVRHAPNVGWRKSWATADASFNAMRFAFMAIKGEMGYPAVLSAKKYGFYAARRGGVAFKFQRPYGDYIIRNSMFKFVTAGMHSQSAVECAIRLHPLVKGRLGDVKRVVLHSQRALIGIMDKTGVLNNPADRDHCAQYVVAIGLIFGRLVAADFEDHVAADPRIDALRAKTEIVEDARYSRNFYDPKKRSSSNALQVFFNDGSRTPKIEVEYPIGHPRRRKEVGPVLRAKLEASLARRYAPKRRSLILKLCADARRLDATPVNKFVDLFVA